MSLKARMLSERSQLHDEMPKPTSVVESRSVVSRVLGGEEESDFWIWGSSW